MTKQEFIAKLAPLAVADMKKTKVFASLKLAQGALETDCSVCYGVLKIGDSSRDKEIIEDARLEEIRSFKFKNWKDCKDVSELQKIQKARGYKPGWVYYRSRDLGFIQS